MYSFVPLYALLASHGGSYICGTVIHVTGGRPGGSVPDKDPKRSILMTNSRKEHLEIVAATLTQCYYTQHTTASRDYRELLDTYDYILEALIEKDKLPEGQSPLTASDTLANPETAGSRD